ncbi:MAG: hypothetical protein WCE62_11685 [Polyangiales bacterium]
MKRALRVLDDSAEPPVAAPVLVTLGNRLVSITDAGGGLASRRFADALINAGGAPLGARNGAGPSLRIVIRGTPRSAAARLRAEGLETTADLILGSFRPVFATYLGRLAPVG